MEAGYRKAFEKCLVIGAEMMNITVKMIGRGPIERRWCVLYKSGFHTIDFSDLCGRRSSSLLT